MSTIVATRNITSGIKSRPSTPIRRQCLASLNCNLTYNINIQKALIDLIDQLKGSTDSSTQLLIRLYYHKSARLDDQPEKLHLFQQEIYSGLRRLHPTIINSSLMEQENDHCLMPKPVITSRSAQATIRKLH